jgi:HPt (histidine-containing phosphotransfer) domain-containing protein
MNLEELATRIGIKESELKELIDLFFETSYLDLEHLRSALEKGASAEVSRAAHSIKGAALSLGMSEIADLAKTIEHEARERRLEGISSFLIPLGEALRETDSRLNRIPKAAVSSGPQPG